MNARRNTRQRETILEVIQHASGPLGVPEILERSRSQIPGLGLATGYCTLTLLKDGKQALEVVCLRFPRVLGLGTRVMAVLP